MGRGISVATFRIHDSNPSLIWAIHTLKPSMDGTIRYGEAKNPGPTTGDLLTVGVSNPGGLRQKEDILLGMGPGIWP